MTYFHCSFDTNYTIKPGEVWRLQNWLPHLYHPISHWFLTIPISIISEIFQENPNKLKSIQIDRLQLIFLLNPSIYPWLTILQLYHMTEYPVSHPIQLSRVIQTCFFVPSHYHVLFNLFNPLVLFTPCYTIYPSSRVIHPI